MNEKKIMTDAELEKELKSRMTSLSSHIDRFDKISKRVFVENTDEQEYSEVIVSDVENVTSRHRIPRFLKWGAVAAAAAVVIGVIPKTPKFNEFLANVNDYCDKDFSALIREIETETDKNEYIEIDLKLSEYAAYDVLVDPIYGCPFAADPCEDKNVRIFIRDLGYGTYTNQMYAVEYTGEYKPVNFIAAAETAAKFDESDIELYKSAYEKLMDKHNNVDINDLIENIKSDDEISWLPESPVFMISLYPYDYVAVNNNFTGDKDGELYDSNYESSIVASFKRSYLIKDDEGLHGITADMIYSKKADDDVHYRYDTSLTCFNDGSIKETEIPDMYNKWSRSIYSDGTSAFPVDNDSYFEKVDYFSGIDLNKYEKNDHLNIDSTVNSFQPYGVYNMYSNAEHDLDTGKISIIEIRYEDSIRTIAVPSIDNNDKYYWDIYASALSVEKNRKTIFKEQDTDVEMNMQGYVYFYDSDGNEITGINSDVLDSIKTESDNGEGSNFIIYSRF